jgi:hypothetical protein
MERKKERYLVALRAEVKGTKISDEINKLTAWVGACAGVRVQEREKDKVLVFLSLN